jgi:hypothetical protein
VAKMPAMLLNKTLKRLRGRLGLKNNEPRLNPEADPGTELAIGIAMGFNQ